MPALLATFAQELWSVYLLVPLLCSFLMLPLLTVLTKVPLAYNVMNLAVRWRSSAMTGLAFALVTALLVIMLGFVNGMYAVTQNSGQPGNVIVLAEGATDESFSNLGESSLGQLENQPQVLVENGKRLASRETYLIVGQPIAFPKPGGPNRRFLQVRGLADPVIAGRVHGLKLDPGGDWFSDSGVRKLGDSESTAIEVVLGFGIARELGNDRSPEVLAAAKRPDSLVAGDTFNVGDRTWYVAGVLTPSNTTFDSEVWAKQSLIGALFGKSTTTTLFVRTDSPKSAGELVEYYQTGFQESRVTAQTETNYFNALSQTNLQFLVAISIVALIMSLGGIFGVMNTMFAAISQRTRDIGVLRLMGFGRFQILVSFLLESLLLALLGGAAGCLLGSFAHGLTANSIVSSGPGGGKFVVLQLTVDTGVILIGMSQALVCGFLGGVIPSLSAMRLTALDALR